MIGTIHLRLFTFWIGKEGPSVLFLASLLEQRMAEAHPSV
jgi:hypothetical protein